MVLTMNRLFTTLIAASICGALAGAAAGFTTSSIIPETQSVPIRNIVTTSTPISVVPTSTFELVPLERRIVTPLVPPAFAKRKVSAVATLYRKTKGTAIEERVFTDDRMLGQAVALTSDGWFVTSASVFEGLRLADVTLWYRGSSYTLEKGIIDHINNTVFFKAPATDLVPSAFAHLQELQSGAEMWLETRSGELTPSIVVSINARTSIGSISSEIISRRIIAGGVSGAGDRGGAAWDPNGSLIGLVDSSAGARVRLIPGSSIATSFASLLKDGEIRHAQLGVNAIDLATMRVDGVRDGLPTYGAWIVDDKKSGKLGITRDLSAFQAKMKTGDVILRVDRDILDGSADLGEILADYQPGTLVTLRVMRQSTDIDVPVTLRQFITSEFIK
jgi:S1-C subfamily serine protease